MRKPKITKAKIKKLYREDKLFLTTKENKQLTTLSDEEKVLLTTAMEEYYWDSFREGRDHHFYLTTCNYKNEKYIDIELVRTTSKDMPLAVLSIDSEIRYRPLTNDEFIKMLSQQTDSFINPRIKNYRKQTSSEDVEENKIQQISNGGLLNKHLKGLKSQGMFNFKFVNLREIRREQFTRLMAMERVDLRISPFADEPDIGPRVLEHVLSTWDWKRYLSCNKDGTSVIFYTESPDKEFTASFLLQKTNKKTKPYNIILVVFKELKSGARWEYMQRYNNYDKTPMRGQIEHAIQSGKYYVTQHFFDKLDKYGIPLETVIEFILKDENNYVYQRDGVGHDSTSADSSIYKITGTYEQGGKSLDAVAIIGRKFNKEENEPQFFLVTFFIKDSAGGNHLFKSKQIQVEENWSYLRGLFKESLKEIRLLDEQNAVSSRMVRLKEEQQVKEKFKKLYPQTTKEILEEQKWYNYGINLIDCYSKM